MYTISRGTVEVASIENINSGIEIDNCTNPFTHIISFIELYIFTNSYQQNIYTCLFRQANVNWQEGGLLLLSSDAIISCHHR